MQRSPAYVIRRAALAKGIKSTTAAVNFVLASELGVSDVASYALVGAARAWVLEKKLQVARINVDKSDAVKAIEAGVGLSADAFDPSLEQSLE